MLLFHTDLYESLFPPQNKKVFATFYFTILTFSLQFCRNLRIARYKLKMLTYNYKCITQLREKSELWGIRSVIFLIKKQIVKCDFIPQFRLLQQMQVKLLLLTCYANCKNISQFWVSSELQESQIFERIQLRC